MFQRAIEADRRGERGPWRRPEEVPKGSQGIDCEGMRDERDERAQGLSHAGRLGEMGLQWRGAWVFILFHFGKKGKIPKTKWEVSM
jgi:hypothetical protein